MDTEYPCTIIMRTSYVCVNKGLCTGAVPSLEGAANQLNSLKKELGLQKVFLSTDAPNNGE